MILSFQRLLLVFIPLRLINRRKSIIKILAIRTMRGKYHTYAPRSLLPAYLSPRFMTASPPDIGKGLTAIRRLRRVFLFILFSFVPLVVVTMAGIERFDTWWPILLPALFFLFGMMVQNRLHRQKCPRCHAFFFVQSVSKDAYIPASSISFPPQKRCQNCGLVLYR